MKARLLIAFVLIGVSQKFSYADLPSTPEALAIIDALIIACTKNQPENESKYLKLRNPPHSCVSYNEPTLVQERETEVYKSAVAEILKGLNTMTQDDLKKLCTSMLDIKC